MKPIIKIIIADDYKLIRDGYISMLRENPIFSVVGEANNGQEVIDLLEQKETDILILDISMPVLDGFDTLQIVKKRFPKVKVLMVSMFDETCYTANCIKKGASGYLTKNGSNEELKEAILSILENKMFFDLHVSKILLTELIEEKKKVLSGLSKSEEDILQFIYTTKTNNEIAELLKGFPEAVKLVIGEKIELLELEGKILVQIALSKRDKEIAEILNISIHTIDKYKRTLKEKTKLESNAGLALYAVKHGYIII
jgi:DNA-binding NarL/FixJ family response regulator